MEATWVERCLVDVAQPLSRPQEMPAKAHSQYLDKFRKKKAQNGVWKERMILPGSGASRSKGISASLLLQLFLPGHWNMQPSLALDSSAGTRRTRWLEC